MIAEQGASNSQPARQSEAQAGRVGVVASSSVAPSSPEGPSPAQLGARLARLRIGRGLTQTALAARAGIPRPYVNALEAGRHEPTVRTLTALARALDVELASLVWHVAGRSYADPQATLGERVAQRRLALGYGRQADFASAAGVARATLNQVERGGIPNPKLSLLVRLAAALQLLSERVGAWSRCTQRRRWRRRGGAEELR